VTGSGLHNGPSTYDAARIAERARLIGYAIDARARRFPEETPYVYAPHQGETYRWDAEAKAGITDYNLLDLSI
jgi:hypothetical protein